MDPDKKARMLRRVHDPAMVPSIYNYCDRWCERCAFIERCSVAQALREHDAEEPGQDPIEAAMEDMSVAMEMLMEDAVARGIDLEEDDGEPLSARPEPPPHLAALADAGWDLSSAVNEWLQRADEMLVAHGEELIARHQLDLPGDDPVGQVRRWRTALEVLHHLHALIASKISRAACHRARELEGSSDSDDAEGSIKVALLAIAESQDAWRSLADFYTADDLAPVAEMLQAYTRLREDLAAAFPHAYTFRRPGFDP